MNAPNFPSFKLSRPLPQVGHSLGSPPSARSGNICGPRISSSAVITSANFRPLVSSAAAWKLVQKSRSNCFQDNSPADTSSSFSSRSAGEPVFAVRVVVAALLVQLEKAVEQSDGAGGPEPRLSVRVGNIHGGAFLLGGFHLARQRALPDQFVEPRLIGIEIAGDLFGNARETG